MQNYVKIITILIILERVVKYLKRKNDKPFWNSLALLTSVGVAMISNLLVGLLIGQFLDNHFHTHPWMTLLFLFLGAGAGMRAIYKLVNK